MLGRLRSPPKTERSAAPGRRLEDLACALDEADLRLASRGETPEQTQRRRHDPVLGIPPRAAAHLRRLARHWDARGAAGLGAPSIGRLRKETTTIPRRDDERKLRAIGRWLRANGQAECILPTVSLTPEMIANLACAHTTCSCATCRDASSGGRTCELVAVCRAAVDLYDLMLTAPASPLGQHLRAVVGAVNALSEIVEQVLAGAPELEALAAQLEGAPDKVSQILREPELAASAGLEFSVVLLRKIAETLCIYLNDRCQFNDLTPRDLGATGAGAPELKRAAEQHLACAGLAFVKCGRALTVGRLRKAPRKRREIADQRTRFIRARTAS